MDIFKALTTALGLEEILKYYPVDKNPLRGPLFLIPGTLVGVQRVSQRQVGSIYGKDFIRIFIKHKGRPYSLLWFGSLMAPEVISFNHGYLFAGWINSKSRSNVLVLRWAFKVPAKHLHEGTGAIGVSEQADLEELDRKAWSEQMTRLDEPCQEHEIEDGVFPKR